MTLPLICYPRGQEALRTRADDPKAVLEMYVSVLNRIGGGYEYVTDVLFGHVNIKNFFMEYDTDRAGDFRPLRHVPKGRKVVLGLVSRTPVLESSGDLTRRIDGA